jgi:hypothetical protein
MASAVFFPARQLPEDSDVPGILDGDMSEYIPTEHFADTRGTGFSMVRDACRLQRSFQHVHCCRKEIAR